MASFECGGGDGIKALWWLLVSCSLLEGNKFIHPSANWNNAMREREREERECIEQKKKST